VNPTNQEVRFLPSGDTALVVEFGDTIDRRINDRVIGLAALIDDHRLPGVVETVPTFRSLLVHYDPALTSGSVLTDAIGRLIGRGQPTAMRRRLVHVPACYHPDCAPDLEAVARATGRSTAEVVRLHSSVRYHVYMIGFLLGYPYMGDLPPELELPRRADPRTRVPAGSIAIASKMTGIYPAASPGGWHLIGMTSIQLFNPSLPLPSLLSPGDEVRFEPVALSEHQRLSELPPAERVTIAEATD
jgi:inhibitor of KinA